MDTQAFTRPVDLKQVKITDAFWRQKIELIRDKVIPYQWEALNDKIPDAQPSYSMHNFRAAGIINEKKATQPDYVQPVFSATEFAVWPKDNEVDSERFYGLLFQDSDFYKWIEAAAYSLYQYPDPKLEEIADYAIDIVCKAQHTDGYLNTYYIINDLSKRFSNLRDNHELYCFGHLTESAIAYYQATGKDKLLKTACRFADYIADNFGHEDGKIKGYPGHEVAEMALARLYEITGEKRYLELGLFFINERGQRPYYYDVERSLKPEDDLKLRHHYHQAHLPVREQTEAFGHSVRAVYLYSGMAEFARLTNDDSLKKACEQLWDDIVQRKMYITGGIGATHIGEAFSFAYDLPNDTAYAETCASIGMVFFARRMLELTGDAKYADVIEREVYNGILSGMTLDGTSFFYVNPLEVYPKACHEDARKEHVKPVRQKWFGCACCPPNLARLISSIGTYAFTENENKLFVHLYIGSKITKRLNDGNATVTIESNFPWDGSVNITVEYEGNESMTLALRIPDWCQDYTINEQANAEMKTEKGYLYITKKWKNESIQLNFIMRPQFIIADTQTRENIGKIALVRGPVVYCLEEEDNGKDLHLLKADPVSDFKIEQKLMLSEPIMEIQTDGWCQQHEVASMLYKEYKNPTFEKATLTWIPYYAWANRGEGEMQVWTRV